MFFSAQTFSFPEFDSDLDIARKWLIELKMLFVGAHHVQQLQQGKIP